MRGQTSVGSTRRGVLAVGALVFWLAISGLLITTGVQVWTNQRWPTATGTVLSCQPVYSYSPRVGGNIPVRTAQNCQVSWPVDGTTQHGAVNLAPTVRVGDRVALYVHGDSVVTRSGQGFGYVFGVIGMAMLLFPLAGVATMLVHRRRTRRRAAARRPGRRERRRRTTTGIAP